MAAVDVGEAATVLAAAAAVPDLPPLGGPAGPVPDVILCLLPVAFLLVVTLYKKLFMPTSRSLPYAAAMMWLIKMCWIGEDPIHITATLIQGALLSLTPLSILCAAFVFFNALTVAQTMPYIAALVRATCRNHPVAEVMLVLWAMGHLIEGASGFGTGPATLPPIMAALGHPPFECLVCLLIMTSAIGPFGSSGIGIWFGLSALDYSRANLVRVTFLVGVCMALMSYPIAWFGARFLLTWQDVRSCWLFVVLSVTSCALPALLASLFSFEAPGLLSGVLGVLLTGLMARRQLGLSQDVPCVAARRLKELESGAAAAVDALPDASAAHMPLQAQVVAQLVDAGAVAQLGVIGTGRKPSAGGGGAFVIELTAVAADSHSLSGGAGSWTQQPQPQSFRVQLQSSEEQTDAAHGLLRALAAQSPATDARGKYPRPDSTLSAPAALAGHEEGEEDGVEDGDDELLPARAVRSHHDMAAYSPAAGRHGRWDAAPECCRAAASPSQGSIAVVGAAGSSSSSASGAGAGAAGDTSAAYLSDRRQLALRLLPWASMLAIVGGTRVPYLQRSNGHELSLHLRSLGDLTISSNLVLQFKDLCRIGVNWSFPLLYVPALLPFIATACATLVAFRHSIPANQSWRDPFKASASKCKSVAPAIIGALVLVALMVQGGRQAPSYIIGYWLSEWLGHGYIAVSMLLGAVGSFFSRSVSTSNLVFGFLQQVAAQKLGLNAMGMLMLQIVGGAAGQMISIANILGGRAIMGLQHIPEGEFVKAALPAALAYYLAGTALALPFLFS